MNRRKRKGTEHAPPNNIHPIFHKTFTEMKSLIYQDETPVERIRLLESMAFDVTESYNYLRNLTEQEIADEQTLFSEQHIALDRIDARRRELMEEINAEIKIHKTRANRALEKVRTKREEVTETVYIIQDFEERKIGIYNNRGELIAERDMRANELQHKMQFSDVSAKAS